MNQREAQTVNLTLPAERRFASLVTQAVEGAAAAFGMGEDDALRLRLAAEEIFLYLADAVCPEREIAIACTNGLYYTRLSFRFTASELNLRGLNITAGTIGEDEAAIGEMGLLIAARTVDRLEITAEGAGRVCVAVTKEKAYPPVDLDLPPPEVPLGVRTVAPESEGIKRLAARTARYCAGPDLPSFFSSPGKVADMVTGGEYRAIAALNHRRDEVGGILYRFLSEKIVQCFGPYAFVPGHEEEIGGALLDACIAAVARTKAVGLLTVTELAPSLRSRFESLGTITLYRRNGAPLVRNYLYRHLHEDPIGEVWIHEALGAFLQRCYDRLVLVRDLRKVRDMGESLPRYSILTVELSPERGEALLRPLWPGNDMGDNILRHLQLLRNEGILTILCE
ncbi:MAG: ATP-binding protein, partial [Syntrophales bacterium]|nr:ATP-binding protein [Syntrophales bacterium]